VSLEPTEWTEELFDAFAAPDNFCQGLQSIYVKAGYYKDMGTGEPILIESTKIIRDALGIIIRKDIERYDYRRAGAPPDRYHRETWSTCRIPGFPTGATLKKINEETTRFYCFGAGLMAGGWKQLARLREVAGYVCYDKHPTDAAVSADGLARLAARGMNTAGPAGLVVDSARPLIQALGEGTVIDQTDAPQTAVWLDPYWTERDLVLDEPDKRTTWVVSKDHTRDALPDIEGPIFTPKPGWRYRLPVPIDPPTLAGRALDVTDAGNQLTISGGGATLHATDNPVHIPPERYRLERRVVSEPSRSASGDPLGLWDPDPGATEPSTLWSESGATDYAGGASSSTPAQTGYSEPGDTSEPTVEDWTVVAELRNETDPGQASWVDPDVLSSGEYSYRARAIIGEEESEPSNTVTLAYAGTSTSGMMRVRVRRAHDGSLELDILAPVDPHLPGPTGTDDVLDYGETVILDPVHAAVAGVTGAGATDGDTVIDPVDLGDDIVGSGDDALGLLDPELPADDTETTDAEELAEEIALRQFARDQEAGLEVDITLTHPLLGLERGQWIQLPAIDWKTLGNDLIISTAIDTDPWMIDGFSLGLSRTSESELSGLDSMVLYLVEP